MNNFAILLWIIKAVNLFVRHVTALYLTPWFVLQWKRKQYTFSVTARPALINSPRYEYACGGLVNISYRNINHPFIGNLSALEDGNGRARTEGVTGRKRNILKG